MPSNSSRDLPDSVKNYLPARAQDIFRAVFNSAWEEYQHDEERAFRVAWAVVEKKDDKTSQWKAKPSA